MHRKLLGTTHYFRVGEKRREEPPTPEGLKRGENNTRRLDLPPAPPKEGRKNKDTNAKLQQPAHYCPD
jgi:hypothetical protein